MIFWRISNYMDLSGKGGWVAPGRWHERGNAVVYCSDHPSTCLLEILVWVDPDQIPKDFQLLKIQAPDDVAVETIDIEPSDLKDIAITRRRGTETLRSNTSCIVRVPSVIMPEATNILINPNHPHAERLTIESAVRYPFDSRLLP